MVSTAQRAEQSSTGEPQLTSQEAENLVEILDRVRSPPPPPHPLFRREIALKSLAQSGRVLQRGECRSEEPVFQNPAEGFTRSWHPPKVLPPVPSDSDGHHPLRLRWVRRYLEGSMGRAPGVHQGFSDTGRDESGKDQTGERRSLAGPVRFAVA